MGLVINVKIEEELNMAANAATLALLSNLIAEEFELSIVVEINGELWECWVLSTSAFHPSLYSNWEFNSFAQVDEHLYGADNTGVHLIGGDDDDGASISTGVVLIPSILMARYNKRIRSGFLGISGTSPSVKLITDNGTEIYTVTNSKINVSRALKGVTWQVIVADFEELNFVELVPIVLVR